MVNPSLKTAGLFAVVIALFVVVGGVVGEFLFGGLLAGLVTALGLALAFNLVSYFLCDKFVLWSSGAKIVRPEDAPRLAHIVAELAPQFGLIEPRIAIVPTATPNAFATGRNPKHAVVAATEGILRLCDDRELRGVLAHELAHVKDRDILVMTLAATLAGAISYLAQAFLFSEMFGGGSNGGRGNVNPILVIVAVITAPIAALLLQLAISRSRELKADEVGARTIHDPEALASALAKLEVGNARRPGPIGTPATSALCIVNPLSGGWVAGLFSTHPPMAERIRRLHAMRPEFGYLPKSSGRSGRDYSYHLPAAPR
ncbi:MAG: M48 family metalloprotease [Thermoplasmata archaeon]|nr:M48 family metalloprotease [Thermoplasmata archaeon]MCI4338313.1 M48 family metalloprotease [Thermoplasmata archaeon]MCI4342165.1 M48 family metalloprotease [Thermoplasmata archaeon]